MISKPFVKPRPDRTTDPRACAGWEAEQDVSFVLHRLFGDPANRSVRVFNDLRFPAIFASGATAEGDFAQIDHLVLHRSGMALIESKSVHGELHVDRQGQWQRRSHGRADNIPSPVTQVERQASALRELCRSANPPLLDKLLGLVQMTFREFPMRPYVAIGSKGRFVGDVRAFEGVVMKVDQIVRAVSEEVETHRKRAGFIGLVRGAIANDTSDAGTFKLSDAAMDRIETFLLSKHVSGHGTAPRASPETTSKPSAPLRTLGDRIERLEVLTCGKCGSHDTRVVFARDYCLKCRECGKYTPLAYACPLCGKHATVRKDGPVHFRECDGPGGCGKRTVFSR